MVYLLASTISTAAVGAFVYGSVLKAQDRAIEDRLLEETRGLQHLYAIKGLAALQASVAARALGGGAIVVGLSDASGKPLAGDLRPKRNDRGEPTIGLSDGVEEDDDEPSDGPPETVRALTSRLADGSYLVVGDERDRINALRDEIFASFSWGLVAMLILCLTGGAWLSFQFLGRIEAMRTAAREIMEGDWGRRLPGSLADDGLSALSQTFNRLFDRIEKLLLANRHVSSDIAHDLRKPLAAVLRNLQKARDDPAAIEAAIAGVEGVLATFDALLRIGGVESGARRAAFETVDLAHLVHEVVEDFRPAAEEQGRTLSEALERPLTLQGDPALLTQMVANLIDNALRHTPPGAAVEVFARSVPGGVALGIADSGAGVPAGDHERLFERFYRADASRTTPGVGLGLALVAAIAELHEMRCVALDNRPGLRIAIRSAPAN